MRAGSNLGNVLVHNFRNRHRHVSHSYPGAHSQAGGDCEYNPNRGSLPEGASASAQHGGDYSPPTHNSTPVKEDALAYISQLGEDLATGEWDLNPN